MGIGRRGFIGAGVASLFAGNLLAKPAEDEVKFCAFADIHYFPGVFPHDTREWLERVLNRAEKSKVDFIIHMGDFTPTPVISQAILTHNRAHHRQPRR